MRLLADTQVLLWYVTDPTRLTTAAVQALEKSTQADEPIGVSAFSLVELAYATEKATRAVDQEQVDAVIAVLRHVASPFEVLTVDLAVGEHVPKVPRTNNADPGDRIIIATAEVHDLSIVSSDTKLPSMTGSRIIW